MFMMKPDGKFRLELTFFQYIMLNIIAEDSVIEISTDKLNTISLSMNKFLVEIGPVSMKQDVDSQSLTSFCAIQILRKLDSHQDIHIFQL